MAEKRETLEYVFTEYPGTVVARCSLADIPDYRDDYATGRVYLVRVRDDGEASILQGERVSAK